jgi:exopolysaccharide biosynthesis polyprenyl glycosylphosphotransferase
MSDADAVFEPAGLEPLHKPMIPGRIVSNRHRDRDFVLRRALLVADWFGLWLALVAAMTLAKRSGVTTAESLWILPTLPFWALLFRTYGLYGRPLRRFEPTHLDDMGSLFHALIIGTLGLWLFYKLMPPAQLNLAEVTLFGLFALLLIPGLRVLLRLANLKHQGPERVFVAAPLEEVVQLNRKLSNHPEYEMALVGAATGDRPQDVLDLPVAAGVDELDAVIDSGKIEHLIVQFDARFISQERVVELRRVCFGAGVRFSIFPRQTNLLLPGIEVNYVEGIGFISYHPPILSRTSRCMKRSLDVVVSGLALVVLAPLMALIALGIKLGDGGDVFFRQSRVSRGGQRFLLFKFRTMEPEAERRNDELMSLSSDPDWLILDADPRVTRLGHFLRRTSLDELPQLLNVLRGEMSLVGPRPLSEADDRAVPDWARNRLDVTPGITGHWQVLGRNNIPFREMMEIDYAYVAGWSLLLDLKILLRTIPVVLRRRGAN